MNKKKDRAFLVFMLLMGVLLILGGILLYQGFYGYLNDLRLPGGGEKTAIVMNVHRIPSENMG